jgi:ABC-type dipeptide/oligopeptide/nickel transport system ATPase subunit
LVFHYPPLLGAGTTALDIRSEAEMLHLFSRIRETLHTAILLVSHDTRVLSRIAGRVEMFPREALIYSIENKSVLLETVAKLQFCNEPKVRSNL